MNLAAPLRRRSGLALSVLGLASLTLLTACEVAPINSGYGYGQPYGQPTYNTAPGYVDPQVYGNANMVVQPSPIYVQSMPPAPIYEVQPPMPFVGAIWIGGSYIWRNNNWMWDRGRWESPRPGYAWQAPQYAPRPGGGVTYVPGHWGGGQGGRPYVRPGNQVEPGNPSSFLRPTQPVNPPPMYRQAPVQPQVQPQQPYVRPVQQQQPVAPQQPYNQYNRPMPQQQVAPQPNPQYMRPQAQQPVTVQPAAPQAAAPQRQERRDQVQQQMQQRRDDWQRQQRPAGNTAPFIDRP